MIADVFKIPTGTRVTRNPLFPLGVMDCRGATRGNLVDGFRFWNIGKGKALRRELHICLAQLARGAHVGADAIIVSDAAPNVKWQYAAARCRGDVAGPRMMLGA